MSVEQTALLEPGLSETVCATLLDVMRKGMDEVVSRGVPADWLKVFDRAEISESIRRIT